MRTLAIAAIVAALAAPAFAQTPAAPAPAAAAPGAPAVFQVIRPTDKDMTCADLSSELNILNAVIQQQQTETAAAAAKAANSRATLGRLGGAALALGGQAGLMNGAMSNPLARGLFSAANQMANSAATTAPAANAAPAVMSPQQQRMNMLMASYQTKAC